jgi:cytochrome c
MKKVLKLAMMLMAVASAQLAHADMKADDIAAARAMFAGLGCANCHEVSGKSTGPSLKAMAQRYKGKKVANELADRIRDGSMGRWGKVELHPPQGMLEPAEARLLANWVLNGAP